MNSRMVRKVVRVLLHPVRRHSYAIIYASFPLPLRVLHSLKFRIPLSLYEVLLVVLFVHRTDETQNLY